MLYQQPQRISFFRIIEIIFTINVVILNFFVIRSFLANSTVSKSTQQYLPPVVPTVTPVVTQTPTGIPTSTPTTIPASSNSTTISNQSSVKELFIPLGQGQNSSSDWEDVAGAQTYLDSASYTGVKQILFEASIVVPTANETVSIRLYDKTQDHPVWYSSMSMTGASQFLTSPSISLDSGHNLYQVQMDTQLQYPATLEQARLHVILR